MLSKKQKEIRIQALTKAFQGLNKRLESEMLLMQAFKKALDKVKEKRLSKKDDALLKQLEKQIEDINKE